MYSLCSGNLHYTGHLILENMVKIFSEHTKAKGESSRRSCQAPFANQLPQVRKGRGCLEKRQAMASRVGGSAGRAGSARRGPHLQQVTHACIGACVAGRCHRALAAQYVPTWQCRRVIHRILHRAEVEIASHTSSRRPRLPKLTFVFNTQCQMQKMQASRVQG